MIQQGLLRNQSGSGTIYPAELASSALCEEGLTSSGTIAETVTMAVAIKLTRVDSAYPLCDPTHHYLLTIVKDGTNATVFKQDVEIGSHITTASTDAELVCEVLNTYAGTDEGYFSRIAVVEDALFYSDFWKISPSVPGLWVARSLTGLTLSTLLEFTDADDLGTDSSGNGNDWILPNAVQSTDTPSNNFATLNPLASGTYSDFSDGNLSAVGVATNYVSVSHFGMGSGKWYWEISNSGTGDDMIGISDRSNSMSAQYPGSFTESYAYQTDQQHYFRANGAVVRTDMDGCLIGSTMMWAFDADIGAAWVGVDGVWQDGATNEQIASGDTTHAVVTGITVGKTFFPALSTQAGSLETFDFGQNGYAYTPPEGFLPLCDASRPEPTFADSEEYAHASTLVASGEDVTVSLGFDLEGADFLVNLVNLTTAEDPRWFDSVVGLDRWNLPRTNAARATEATSCSVSGTDLTIPASWLTSGDTYSLFVLRACVETGLEIQVATNTNGSDTVLNHGLGSTPRLAMVNPVEGGATSGIVVYHEDLGESAFTHFGGAATATRGAGYWPLATTTQFQLPDYDADEFPDGEIAVYLFCDAEFGRVVTGITGNASADGPYVDMGGQLLCLAFQKCASSTSPYLQYNLARAPMNPVNHSIWLGWSSNVVEQTSAYIQPTSTGYKMVESSNTTNKSGGVSIGYGVLAQTKYRNAF